MVEGVQVFDSDIERANRITLLANRKGVLNSLGSGEFRGIRARVVLVPERLHFAAVVALRRQIFQRHSAFVQPPDRRRDAWWQLCEQVFTRGGRFIQAIEHRSNATSATSATSAASARWREHARHSALAQFLAADLVPCFVVANQELAIPEINLLGFRDFAYRLRSRPQILNVLARLRAALFLALFQTLGDLRSLHELGQRAHVAHEVKAALEANRHDLVILGCRTVARHRRVVVQRLAIRTHLVGVDAQNRVHLVRVVHAIGVARRHQAHHFLFRDRAAVRAGLANTALEVRRPQQAVDALDLQVVVAVLQSVLDVLDVLRHLRHLLQRHAGGADPMQVQVFRWRVVQTHLAALHAREEVDGLLPRSAQLRLQLAVALFVFRIHRHVLQLSRLGRCLKVSDAFLKCRGRQR